MVPDWVRGLAQAWGSEVRQFEQRIKSVQGTMGRIREEGEGAAIRGFGDNIPHVDFPRQVQQFHRAWIDLDFHHKAAIWVQFKETWRRPKKMQTLGKESTTSYYRAVNKALVAIAVDYRLYAD